MGWSSFSSDIVKLLLDTCTFIWMLQNPQKISPVVRDIWENRDNELYLSAVSVWEIARKYNKRKLHFPEAPEKIIMKEMELNELIGIAFTLQASLRSIDLPFHHRDPFDRMLICQALAHDLTILTPDTEFRKYEEVKVVW